MAYCFGASDPASSSTDPYEDGLFSVSVAGGDIEEGITEANTRSVTQDPDTNTSVATQRQYYMSAHRVLIATQIISILFDFKDGFGTHTKTVTLVELQKFLFYLFSE